MVDYRRKPRVLHLTSVHSSHDVRIYEKECRSLAKSGYDVVLVAPNDCDAAFEDGVLVKGLRRRHSRLTRMSLSALQALQEAQHESADVYHFHDPELLPVGWFLSICGKKVIYDVHEDAPRTIQNKSYIPRVFRSWLARSLESLELRAAKRFAGIVAATPTIANRFYSTNARTCVVNNYPILLRTTPTPWGGRDRSVIYVGTMTEARGIRQLVDAMDQKQNGDTRLVLAGRFMPETLLWDVKRMSGWRRVDYKGCVPPHEVPDLLSRAQAGLVVLQPKSNYLLSQPVKMYEYMAAGIPVIASDFPLWRAIIEAAHCGVLVDPLNSRAIAEAIQHIISHPAEAEAMGQRGREAVERGCNWVSEERTLLALYESIVRG